MEISLLAQNRPVNRVAICSTIQIETGGLSALPTFALPFLASI